MTAAALAAAAGIYLLAAVVQTVSGFGFALVAVPLLALVIDPAAAVVATTMVSLLLTIPTVVADRADISRRDVVIMALAGLVGMPVGLAVLSRVPADALTVLIAVVLLAATAVLVRGLQLPGGRGTEVGVGVLSGALLTSTGMNGPPLVVAFQARGMGPRQFRGTLSSVFLAQGVVAVALMAASGEVTGPALASAAVGIPMLGIGWVVGDRMFRSLPPHVFRRVVLGLLVTSALVSLAGAIPSLLGRG